MYYMHKDLQFFVSFLFLLMFISNIRVIYPSLIVNKIPGLSM